MYEAEYQVLMRNENHQVIDEYNQVELKSFLELTIDDSLNNWKHVYVNL